MSAIDRRSAPEKAKEGVDAAIESIMAFHERARTYGLLSMLPCINKNAVQDRNNLLEYGLALVCMGVDGAEIADILQNIQSHKEASYSQKIIDTLYIVGVLAIQQGTSPSQLIQRLDSRVPEQSRSEALKKRIAEIALSLVDEEEYERVYLHPEEAAAEFEKLASLTDSQVQQLMRDIDSETMAWAVRDNEKIKGVFLHNMSGAAVEGMEADIKDLREGKVLQAQKKIVAAAQRHKFI